MLIVTLLIVVFAILGVPLFCVIALSAITNFLGSGAEIIIVPQEIAGIANMPLLHSIPLFTFAGYVLAHSQASKRLVRVTKAALGWMPGGLAIVTLLACSLFTAFTGASGVTIVALGGVLLPALLSEKYGEKYSLGLVTTSGSFGLLFPPSLPIIFFGIIASVSIDKLFIAGMIPGFFLILVLSLHAMFMSKRFHITKETFSWKELGGALWEARWEIPLPVVIFAGIYSGKLAISDAAAVTVVYVLIVELFLTRDVKIKDLPEIMRECMVLIGALLIIMAASLATTNYMIDAQIPQKMFEFFQGFITNKWVFFIILNIFLLFIGCIMDIFSALIIVVPLILPIAESYNIDLIHLGIVFLVNLQIGYITPPVGMNLFIASIRFNKSVIQLYKAALIFIGLLLVCLAIVTYVPGLSTWFIEKPSIVGQWEYQDSMGNIDKISIKTCGVYERSKGSMIDIMMNEPAVGAYTITKNTIVFNAMGVEEEYEFEIYQSGKRLLLKSPEQEEVAESEGLSDEKTDEAFEDEYDDWFEDEEDAGEIDTGSKFYKNTLSSPINVKTGRFVGRWKYEKGIFIFDLNGIAVRESAGKENKFRYRVRNGRKIVLTAYSEDETIEDPEKIIFNYKFSDSCNLILKNKKIRYNLEYDK